MSRSAAYIHVFRLEPKADLKASILAFAKQHHIAAGVIVTCVGSLEKANLRFANQKDGNHQSGFFEIVSLTGTFSHEEGHFHISIAGPDGKVIGGHLLEGNVIYTTAEIAIAALGDVVFSREPDAYYGYRELVIKTKKP